MADEADIGRLFETAERELGPVSGIVCNTGITGRITRVEDMSTAAIREIMDLNVVGLMIANREAVRRMSTKRGGSGGATVNLSSAAPRSGGTTATVHSGPSKAAVGGRTPDLRPDGGGGGPR